MKDVKWIRLDVNWDDEEWLFVLSAESQLAWMKLLCHVKRNGVGNAGPRMAASVAAKRWGVGVEAVEKLEYAATMAGALAIDGHSWVVTDETVCNAGKDRTVNERVRRHRLKAKVKRGNGVTPVTTEEPLAGEDLKEPEGQSAGEGGNGGNGVSPLATESNATPCHATLTLTKTLTERDIAGAQAVTDSPPNALQAAERFDLAFWLIYKPLNNESPIGARRAFIEAVVESGADPEMLIQRARDYVEFCALSGRFPQKAENWLDTGNYDVDWATKEPDGPPPRGGPTTIADRKTQLAAERRRRGA